MSYTKSLTTAALAGLLSAALVTSGVASASEEKNTSVATKNKPAAEKAHCHSKKKDEKSDCKMCCASKDGEKAKEDKTK